jgi:two-component system sensor histidine kinase YesM
MLDDWRIDEVGHLIRYRLQLRHYLDSFVTAYPLVDAVEFYTTNNAVIQGGSVFRLTDEARNKDWVQTLAGSDVRSIAIAHIDDQIILPSRRLSLVRDLGTSRNAGRDIETILRIELSLSMLAEMLRRSTPYGVTHLVDPRGQVVASGARYGTDDSALRYRSIDEILSQSDFEIVQEEALFSEGAFAKYRIVGAFPYRGAEALPVRLSVLVGALAVSSVLIASLIQLGIGYSLTRRLRLLSSSIRKSDADRFPPVLEPAGGDELGATISAYNRMTSTIERLLDEVYQEGLAVNRLAVEKRHAELEALFSKINPHFLSNSLNTIRMKSLKRSEVETAAALKALSRLFDYLTAWQDETITVGQEITFITDFLALQRYRFGDRYEFAVCADDEVRSVAIPRMLVQPIVENASVHGIEAKKQRGRIDVGFELVGDRVRIIVADNGTGMDGETLERQRKRLRAATLTGDSIGLQNVYNRLVLAFGNAATLDLESTLGEGTRVTLSFPVERSELLCEQ